MPKLTIVMLAYGEEPYLGDALAAVLASEGAELELVLVDNGTTSDVVRSLPADDRITLLTPGTNLGFTGGVNLGARHARGTYVGTVNSDAIVEPGTLALLVEHLDRHPDVGVVGATIVLADDPGTINSAGNPLHVLGLSWAGQMGKPVASLPAVADVASVSGATMVLRRSLWEALGGFPDQFFAYFEDMELSWRAHQAGLGVQVLGGARVRHHYEFSRSPLKMYLVERNRWLFLLTCFEKRTLAAVALPLLAFELALSVVALAQGWGRQKAAGWRWVLTHARWIRERRTLVQRTRTVPDAALVRLFTATFDPAQTPLPSAAAPLEGLLRGYWRLASRFVAR
ncbi:glycosyltransferase family 2 protein [Xylanimonas protaetiae]|uniref:Glycosyltransferase family 2 protein n=1 Tax=Xylanimonas protaetiae TaxID=2509457 RepID=A0A4P6FE64_9MICO|nr:glycosyltransferase family 2 protein [Xylanimonas protaetiae]QAY68898.1 glycosyltransferase family 2 protein [Xylanimonas protaetiae]